MTNSEQKRGPWWLWALAIITLLPLLAYGGLRFYIGQQTEERLAGLDPAQRALLEGMMDKPLEFPLAWRKAEPFSPELVKASNEFIAANEALVLPKGSSGFPVEPTSLIPDPGNPKLSPEETAKHKADILAANQNVFAKIRALASVPDYNFNAVRDTRKGFDVPFEASPAGMKVINATTLLVFDAEAKAAANDWPGAFDAIVEALSLGRAHPASSLITRMMSASSQRYPAQVTFGLVHKCADEAVLAKALEKLNDLEAELRWDIPELEILQLLDAAAYLRDYKRKGYPVDLDSKEPGIYFWRQFMTALEDYPEWRAPQLPSGDPERVHLEQRPKAVEKDWFVRNRDWSRRLGFERDVDLYYLTIAMPNWDNFAMHLRVTQSRRDLLRLTMAARIVQLRTGADDLAPLTPEQMSEFFPGETLEDPFAPGSPYLWDAVRQAYYSVGPDGKDESAKTLISGMNNYSSGDIFFE